MLDPVEIDIRMKQNVTEESEKATGAMGKMDEASKKMHEEVMAMLEERKKMVADIENNLTKTASNISKTSDTLSDDAGKLNQASDILRDSLEDAKKQIAEVEASLASGTTTIEDYSKASDELNRVGGELADIFTKSNELQDISNELMKIGKGNINRLVRSKRLLAKANQWVAKTFKLSEAAAKRFTAVLSFGLTIAISGLITLYEKYKEKQEEARLKAEELIKVEQEKRKEIADSYASEQAKIEAMRTALNSENVSRNDKLNIIKKLKAQIPGYNAELDAEGRLIRENKASIDQYLISLEKSLKLRAAEKDLGEIYSKIYEKERERFESEQNEPKKTTFNGHEITIPGSGNNNRFQFSEKQKEVFKQLGDREIEKLQKEADVILDYINAGGLVELTKPEKTRTPKKAKAAKVAKEEYNAQKALADQLIDLRKRTAELEIDIMQDGFEKRIAQINHEEKQELDRITEQQQKIVDTYNKKYGKEIKDIKDIPGIDSETLAAIEAEKTKITAAAEKKRKDAAAEANAEIIQLANSYAEERVQIAMQYQEDIEKLEKEGQVAAANAARAERDKRISDATAEMLMNTELYKTATDEKLQISAEATAQLIAHIEKRIQAEVAAGNLSREKAKELLDEVNKTGISRESSKNENNPFAKLIKGLNDYKAAKKALDNKKDTVTPEKYAKLEDAANKALKSTAESAAYSLAGVQDILGATVEALDHLGVLTEEEKEAANEVIGMVGGAADIAMGIATGNPIGIITGAVNLLTSAISFFDFKSKKIAKRQKEHKKNLDELARAYNNLQHEVDKALGTDIYDKQKKAIDNLRKQIAENERLIALENKKKKKKRDQEAIAGWKAEIDALKNEIDDTLTSITEDLAQTNAKDLAHTLADALVNAARTGEDAFTAMGDVVNDVLRNAVVNSLSKKFLEKQMGEATEYLAGAMEDGKLTEQEKQNFKDIIESAGRNFNAALAAYDELFAQQEEKAEETRRSASKGIAQASQDSIDELAGTVTFIAGELRTMNVLAAARTESSKDVQMSTRAMLVVLNTIAENTAYCRRLEDVVENLEKMNRDGINIKR